ncbi:MAG TPA: hypothetical protein VGP55_08955 [Chitinophagaceae bacterium]|nr:hypothetical protein [Chitinophagaceae bacterium]
MKFYLNVCAVLVVTPFIFCMASAQHLRFENISLGYKVFYIDGVGNNPTTIAALMKDHVSYQNFLSSLNYNGIFGNPEIQALKTFYINTEIFKENTFSHFWRKYRVQTGFLITNKLEKKGLGVERRDYSAADSTLTINSYSLVQNQKFLGVTAGLNRRIKISNKLNFLIGLHFQASFALQHYYQQQLDSFSINNSGRFSSSTQLPDRKGKNFFQWQAIVPFGLEVDIYKKQFYVRAEGDAGIIGSRYRPKNSYKNQAWGIGLATIYRFTWKK